MSARVKSMKACSMSFTAYLAPQEFDSARTELIEKFADQRKSAEIRIRLE
jgi:hypothetical protein